MQLQEPKRARLLSISTLEKKYPAHIGYLYAFLTHFIGVVGTYLIQRVSRDFSSNQVLHFVGVQLVAYNYATASHKKLPCCPSNPSITSKLILRALAGMTSGILFYGGLPLAPLSEATVVQMSTPVMTGILALAFLNERYDRTLLLTTIFSLMGILMITKPPFLFGATEDDSQYPYKTFGLIILLVSSLFNSFGQILIKKLGAVSNAYTTSFYVGIGFCFSSSLGQIMQGVTSPADWIPYLWILLIGASRYLTHLLNNKSYALGNAGKISLISYAQVPVAYLIDLVIVGRELDFYSGLGSLSVFSSMFIMLFKQFKQSKTAKK